MKIRLALLTAVATTICAVLLLVGGTGSARPVHAAGGGCGATYAQGFFGFSGQQLFTSATAAPAPIAVAGAIFLTSDNPSDVTVLTGTIGGYWTYNSRGTVTRSDISGTYAMVSGHCYGTATITPTVGLVTHWDLVPVGWSNGGIPTQVLFVETDPHKIGTLTAISM
jgi:hypothetical protein